MSPVLPVDPSNAVGEAEALRRAAEAVAAGELIVLPTETVYGIAGRPDDHRATARLFEAKRRPQNLSLPVLAPSAAEAWEIADPDPGAAALAEAFWPGGLTLVLPRTARSRGWRLGAADGSIAVRVPAHPVALELLHLTGPLAATSANRSGSPPLEDPRSLVETFGGAVAVYVVLPPEAPPPAGRPSTVLDLTGGEPRLLRQGAVGAADLREALARSGTKVHSLDFG